MGITPGNVLIITAPSGAGKTTIIKTLLKNFADLMFSVSATTRPPREIEINGKDYYFLSIAEFKNKIKKGLFVEYEEVYPGKYYGTLQSEINRIWSLGKTVVFDVDVKGAINLKQYFRNNSLAIFIQPPSIKVLKKRLENRSSENPENLKQRLERAEMELNYAGEFDEVIINDELKDTLRHSIDIVVRYLTAI
jgi:guanylate kinase